MKVFELEITCHRKRQNVTSDQTYHLSQIVLEQQISWFDKCHSFWIWYVTEIFVIVEA